MADSLSHVNQKCGPNPSYASVRSSMWKKVDSAFCCVLCLPVMDTEHPIENLQRLALSVLEEACVRLYPLWLVQLYTLPIGENWLTDGN